MDTIVCPKCAHAHEPCGSHEDDSGQHECQSCGFKFLVEIEYDPSYSTSCVVHEYGELKGIWRSCIHCGYIKLEDSA